MTHDFDEWFEDNTPEYTHDQFYHENVTYTKQFVKDAWYDGYYTADTWHDCKDELPSNTAMLLLARKTVNGIQALIGYYKDNQFVKFNEKSCKMESVDYVYAWKEIHLPTPLSEN